MTTSRTHLAQSLLNPLHRLILPITEPSSLQQNSTDISTIVLTTSREVYQQTCPHSNDGYLEWPATVANLSAWQKCPSGWYGIDPSLNVSRHCSIDGKWGTTTYVDCLASQLQQEYDLLYKGVDDINQQYIHRLLNTTRAIEMTGLCISAFSICLALFLFKKIKSLKCIRTKLHTHLLYALLLQTLTRIGSYAVQLNLQTDDGMRISQKVSARFCELFIILSQMSTTATFMWMLCEGVHLCATLTSLRRFLLLYHYAIAGWLVPFVVVGIWTILMYKNVNLMCWPSYQIAPLFWIIRAMRLTTMLLNFCILIVALRITTKHVKNLVDPSNNSSSIATPATTETTASGSRNSSAPIGTGRRTSVRFVVIIKSTKSALLLLPMLGLVNIIEEVPVSFHRLGKIGFSVYVVARHTLISMQGLLVACVYCFRNAHVRQWFSSSMR